MSAVAIQCQGLSKRYRLGEQERYRTLRDTMANATARLVSRIRRAPQPPAIWALDDVSFEVRRGEALGIIGRNGAGKSTLLKILSRITKPTRGRVVIRGRVGSLLEVGTGFHPELTGRENVFLNGAILGMKRREIQRRFDEIVAFAEIEPFLDTPVKRYSSGMYMRLAFATAAHLEAEVVLLDEILAVGDIAFQRKCLGHMDRSTHQGRTVLFVSHNLQAVRQFCPQTIWLDGGRIAAAGTTEQVIELYLNSLRAPAREGGLDEQIANFPPDPAFRLHKVTLAQDAMVPGGDFTAGRPIELMIEYEVFEETEGLHVYFQLWDREGTLLIESIHNGDADSHPIVQAGRYVSRARLPADFLAPMEYELHVLAGIHGVRFLTPEPVRFSLPVQGLGRVNRAYSGYTTPAKLAPWIEWQTELVNVAAGVS